MFAKSFVCILNCNDNCIFRECKRISETGGERRQAATHADQDRFREEESKVIAQYSALAEKARQLHEEAAQL